MKISDALHGIHILGIETSPFIYYVENHPIYSDKVDAIFQIVENDGISIKVSTITLTETLKKPLELGDLKLATTYREMLHTSSYIELVAVSAEIADRAAQLRATYNLKTPDSLHIASAIVFGCTALLTNDKSLRRVSEIRVLLLDELELDIPAS